MLVQELSDRGPGRDWHVLRRAPHPLANVARVGALDRVVVHRLERGAAEQPPDAVRTPGHPQRRAPVGDGDAARAVAARGGAHRQPVAVAQALDGVQRGRALDHALEHVPACKGRVGHVASGHGGAERTKWGWGGGTRLWTGEEQWDVYTLPANT